MMMYGRTGTAGVRRYGRRGRDVMMNWQGAKRTFWFRKEDKGKGEGGGKGGVGGGSGAGGGGGNSSGNGEAAPKMPSLLALPVDRKPLFPGTVHTVTVQNPTVRGGKG